MENFFTKIERPSVSKIEIEDIDRMKQYQLALIDFALYETPRYQTGGLYQKKVTGIYNDISECEKWLKKNTEELVNDNNRNLIN